MKKQSLRALRSVVTAFSAVAAIGNASPTVHAQDNYSATILRERQAVEERLRQPDDWLTLVALRELRDGTMTIGSGEGADVQIEHGPALALVVVRSKDEITITPKDAALTLHGQSISAPVFVKPSDDPADALRWDSLTLSVIARGDKLYIRMRDAQAVALKDFKHLNFYPVNERYLVKARWVPYKAAHTLVMTTQTGQELKLPAPGYAEFSLQGKVVHLEPYELMGGKLEFLFRDRTSDTLSYGAGRTLIVDGPSNGLKRAGIVLLDFNRAYNPPCAYTPFGTCPMPPPGNIVPIDIPAGEQRYHAD